MQLFSTFGSDKINFPHFQVPEALGFCYIKGLMMVGPHGGEGGGLFFITFWVNCS